MTDLLAGYRPEPDRWDEMVDGDGRVRLGIDELGRRRDEAVRLLADDGVTGHWRLDPVPAVVSSDEWATIERGLIQRAELLTMVLQDLYGPRELLRKGLLAARAGVCQDFAHVMIGCLRSLGLAARYVSGYLETDPPPGQPRLQGVDASHAWVSVWVPDTGWVDVDPTNDTFVGERHVTVGWGRDYRDVE